MYGINPYAPVNPAMAGVTQQRLANYQSQMPQMSTYQPQQFVPQPPYAFDDERTYSSQLRRSKGCSN